MIEFRAASYLSSFSLDADFTVPSSGITALYGRSGSGKTSVLRMIAGALRPTRGRIIVGDRVFFDADAGIDVPVHERRVGYVFQASRLFPHFSVKGNLTYGYKRVRRARSHSLDDVIDLLGLAPLMARRTHALSGGERQRVAIGRALLAEPELLLMDEPLSSLDPQRKAEVLPYIERLRDQFKLPIFYVSHAFGEIVRLADHLVVIDAGRVVRAGSLIDLASDPDLSPYLGRFEAGSIVECTVRGHDVAAALTTLAFSGGMLRVPRLEVSVGQRLRVRIRARDVAIALSNPPDISISNRLPGHIVRIAPQDGPYMAVMIDIGGTQLRALITRDSSARLGLVPGLAVYALIKTVAFDSRSAGLSRVMPALSEDGA